MGSVEGAAAVDGDGLFGEAVIMIIIIIIMIIMIIIIMLIL